MLLAILTSVSFILTTVLVAIANHRFDFNIQGYSFWFIIPIGSIIVGFVASSGILFKKRISKKPLPAFIFILALIVGLASFFSSTYLSHCLWRRDSLEKVAQWKETSEYTNLSEQDAKLVDGELAQNFSFLTTLKNMYEDSEIALGGKGKGATISNPWVSRISFVLTIIGAGLGGILVAVAATSDSIKCRKSKKYIRPLKTLYFEVEEYAKISKKLKSKRISVVEITKILKKQNAQINKKLDHTEMAIYESPQEEIGDIVIIKYVFVKDKLNNEEELRVDLDSKQIKELKKYLKDSE